MMTRATDGERASLWAKNSSDRMRDNIWTQLKAKNIKKGFLKRCLLTNDAPHDKTSTRKSAKILASEPTPSRIGPQKAHSLWKSVLKKEKVQRLKISSTKRSYFDRWPKKINHDIEFGILKKRASLYSLTSTSPPSHHHRILSRRS